MLLLQDLKLHSKGGGVSHKDSEREKPRNNCYSVNNDSRKDNFEYERTAEFLYNRVCDRVGV